MNRAISILVGAFLLSAGADGQLDLSSRVTISLEGRPGSVAAADLTGNGHQDLIVTDLDAGSVVVLLGNGTGTFVRSEGSPFPAGKKPEDIAVDDFNGDGNPDIVVANHETDHLTLLLGDGVGRFEEAPASPVRVTSNPHPHGVASGDFDANGHRDLVTESWQDNEVVVLLGDGQGGFAEPHGRYRVGELPYYKLRAGDLNQDGHSDIVTSNWNGSGLSVLLADSTGGFLPASEVPTAASPFATAIGDVNQDGHPDIGVAHRLGNSAEAHADRISILLGNGRGGFRSALDIAAPGRSPTSVAMGDYDGDTVADLAVANYGSGDVTIILGSTAEDFEQAKDSPVRVGGGPVSVVLSDLDGDGRADVVSANAVSKDLSIVFAP